MDVENVRDRAMNFLRRYGHLENSHSKPRFTDDPILGGPLCASGAYPWNRNNSDFYEQPKTGEEVYTERFQVVQRDFPRILEWDFNEKIIGDIPDSEEYILVDIGSHLGDSNTRSFARRKPHVKVFMIDKIPRDQVELAMKKEISGEWKPDYPFRSYVPIVGSTQDVVNNLFVANGYRNVTYLNKELKLFDEETNLRDIQNALARRKVIFTGFRNPNGLGNITVSEAIYHKAEGVYLTNSALEKITPGSEHFRYMMRFLKENMLDQEIQRIMSLMHDPDSPKGKKRSDKYHYKTTEKYFALALKLMFLLPQVDRLQRSGMDATLYSEKGNENGQNYNNPDHFLKASRK